MNSTVDAVDANPGDGLAEDSLGRTTLRAAIMEANALAGDDSITLGAGVYTLTIGGRNEDGAATGDLDIQSNITITGAGSDQTTIDGNQLDRVFDIHFSQSFEFGGVEVTGGLAMGSAEDLFEDAGGGLRIAFAATVTVENCLFLDNAAVRIDGSFTHGAGGAVESAGDLTILDSRFNGNEAGSSGGAIYVGNTSATTIIRDTAFANNVAPSGGAIFNTRPMTIERSTFVGNTNGASGFGNGGAINNNLDGDLTLVNSTLSGNVSRIGGGLLNFGTATIRNSTITENTASWGGGVDNSGTLNLVNAIVAGNTASNSGPDINGTVNSLGHNLIGDTTGASGFVATDLLNVDPRIESLADNGGPTLTHALLWNSPAIDAANSATAPATDQRGVARPVGDVADIGAFEGQVLGSPPIASADTYIVTEDETLQTTAAAPVVDQQTIGSYNLVTGAGFAGFQQQQQVTAGIAGLLDSVDIYLASNNTAGDVFQFLIHTGPAWQYDNPVYMENIEITEQMVGNWITIDLQSAGIVLAAGDPFTLSVRAVGSGSIWLRGFTTNPYAGGTSWSGSENFSSEHPEDDLAFRTRMIPEPYPSGVLANDSDPDNDALTAVLVSGPAHGTLAFNADGSFIYTPDENYSGPDSFTYRASDGVLTGDPATVTINIAPDHATPESLSITYVIPPPFPFLTEASGTTTGTITRAGDLSGDVVIQLTSSDPGKVSVPETVTIAAGQASADFTITLIDDTIHSGNQFITITATAGSAAAGSLTLNESFGSGGLASTPLTFNSQPPYAVVATLPNGKVLAASEDAADGSWRLIRLNADGTLDTTFGNGGSIVTAFSGSNGAVPRAIFVQADGKILIGGESINELPGQAILARYNADGTLDTSFFNGGINTLGGTDGWITDIAVHTNGKIYLAITGNSGFDFKVVRLTGSGFADNTFGSGGVRTYLGTNAWATEITLTADGGFYLAGDNKVGKFDANGNPVFGFGSSGIATVDFGTPNETVVGLEQLPDGRIVIGYYLFTSDDTADFGAARLNTDGTLDTTFSGDGLATVDFGGLDDYASSMALQNDGKFILAGTTEVNASDEDWAIARLGIDGSLDTSFDGDGLFTQSTATFGADRIFDIAVSGPKLIVLGGWANIQVASYELPGVTVSTQRNLFVVDQEELTVSLSQTTFTEGDPVGIATMTITRNNTNIDEALVVTPVTGLDGFVVEGFLILPESVTIAAGQSSVTFEIGVADNLFVNGTREFQVAAQAPGYIPNVIIATVADDDLGAFGAENILVATDGPGEIREYTPDGTLVRIFQIPELENESTKLRDLAVDTDGNLHFWEETFDSSGIRYELTTINPLTGDIVRNPLLPSWSTDNVVSYGGLSTLNDWVFVTDMATSGGPQTGIIRYDRSTGTSVRFADTGNPALEFIDLTVGLDGLLYGLDDSELVHVYDPATLAELRTIDITQTVFPDNRAIAVNADGDIFAAAWGDGRIRRFDGDTGALLATSTSSFGTLVDINLRVDGTIVVSTWFDGVYLSDEMLTSSTNISLPSHVSGPFIAFAATPPIVNLRPFANPSNFTTNEDTAHSGTVTGSDPESDSLAYAVAIGPAHGTLDFNIGGTFTYTPEANYFGTDSFTVTVSDGNTTSDPATISITVNAVNDAPQANNDSATTNEDTAVTIDVLANDSDADSDSLTVDSVSDPAGGTATINSDGIITFTPDENFNGSDSFTYTISDGNGGTATATVSIAVNAVNDAPVANPSNFSTDEDTVSSGNVTGSDPDSSSLTYAIATGSANGELILNADGSFTYTPNENFQGTDSFTFTVSDGTATSDPATVSITVNTVNDAPVANDDSAMTDEDAGVMINVLANDTDADNDTLTVTSVSSASGGTVTINGDGTITYAPDENFNGPDTFTYTTNDGNGGTARATVSITVTAVNDAPVVESSQVAINEDTTYTFAVDDFGFSDVDGDALAKVLIETLPSSGTLTLNAVAVTGGQEILAGDIAAGQLTYTPDANDTDTDRFLFKVHDGTTSSALDTTMRIDIAAVNDAPVAVDDSATSNEDTAVTIGILANDTDADGDTLAVIDPQRSPANGTLQINGDGTVTYTPNANFNGTDSFTYLTNDGSAASNTATVTITVNAVNDAPAVDDDSATTDEDTSVTINVLANGSDIDDDALTVTAVSDPAGGTAIINGDGTITFTPDENFNGSAGFTYTISDGNGGTATATVSIAVNAVNDAPVANDDSATADEEQAITINVLANDTDVDSDTLTVASVSDPSGGMATINGDGTITFTPDENFNGSDSFTYTISDGNGGTDTATVAVTVGTANDPPLAADDAATTDEDTAVTIDVLANDIDADNDTLTVTSVSDPAGGTATINGDGTITFTPDENVNGSDSFTYTVNDGNGGIDTATVSITVSAINDAPQANDDSATTDEDTGITIDVLVNDIDADGNSLAAPDVQQDPASGTLTFNADGTITYTPNENFNGTDSFTYVTNDGSAVSNVATVTITVVAVNDPPVAGDDAFSTDEDTAYSGNVSGSDPDSQTMTYAVATGPAHGTLALSSDGSFTFAPNENYHGTDSFTFTASDGSATSDPATVSITVNAVNDAPAATNDAFTTDEDTAVSGNLLGNDSDVESDALTAGLVTGPTNGSVTLETDGSFTYTPDADFNGTDSFTYQIDDGTSDSNTATVSITVNAVNDAPVTGGDSATTNEDTAVTVTVLANDTDVDGDTLTITSVSDPAGGTVVVNGNGTITFTPDENFNGSDSFTYTISDGNGGTATATVSITVNAVNDAPQAADDSVNTDESTAVTIDVLTNDSDVDGDTLTITSVTDPVGGTAVVNGDGTVTFTPDENFTGSDSFTYTISDGNGGTDTAAVAVTVGDVIAAPQVVSLEFGYGDDKWASAESLSGRTAPWKITQIRIRFTQDVAVDIGDLVITGMNGTYAISGFSYDASTFTAVWTLATSIEADRVTLSLDGDSSTAGDDGNDGVNTNGEYLAEEDIWEALDVLFGDVSGNGVVSGRDALLIRRVDETYDPWADLNGDGIVDAEDSLMLRGRNGMNFHKLQHQTKRT